MNRTDPTAHADAACVGVPLAIEHRSEIQLLLRKLGRPQSEYCFANLFLFRAAHSYRYVAGAHPFVLGTTYDGVRHALPLAPLTPESVAAMLAQADCLYPLDHDDVASTGLVACWREADSDYVYDARRTAALAGAGLKAKRSQARAFAAAVEPREAWLDDSNRDLALTLLDAWLADTGRAPEETDLAACQEALAQQEALGLEGLLILSGEAPMAFLLASTLADGSKAVHFAKGRWHPAGAYPYLFSRYAARCGATLLNFEQDLGRPGFRQAKRALDPIGQIRKYRLTRG